MSDKTALKLHQTTDAAVWAKEFVRINGGDEELMLTWFANAIMVGHDEGQRRIEQRIAYLEEAAKDLAYTLRRAAKTFRSIGQDEAADQCLEPIKAQARKEVSDD